MLAPAGVGSVTATQRKRSGQSTACVSLSLCVWLKKGQRQVSRRRGLLKAMRVMWGVRGDPTWVRPQAQPTEWVEAYFCVDWLGVWRFTKGWWCLERVMRLMSGRR